MLPARAGSAAADGSLRSLYLMSGTAHTPASGRSYNLGNGRPAGQWGGAGALGRARTGAADRGAGGGAPGTGGHHNRQSRSWRHDVGVNGAVGHEHATGSGAWEGQAKSTVRC